MRIVAAVYGGRTEVRRMRRYVQDAFGSVSGRDRRAADLFFAELVGGSRLRPQAEAFDELWEDDPAPTVTKGRDDDELIVTVADGTKYHVRRRIRAQVLTRPGRPRAGFCKDDERVFFRVGWCEGTQGRIDVGANPQGAFKKLMDDVMQQIRDRKDIEEIKDTFEKATVEAFVEVAIAKVGDWKIEGDVRLEINRNGIASTKAKVTADAGWATFGAQYSDDGTDKRVVATVDIPLSKRRPGGKKCPERELAVWWEAECYREEPVTNTLPLRGVVYEHVRLYFDHAKDTLRRESPTKDDVEDILKSEPKGGIDLLNKAELEKLDYLVRQSSFLVSVRGYTSPEGRRGPAPTGSSSKWEGNDELSAARAEKVRKLIATRFGPGGPIRRIMVFPGGGSMPKGIAESERPRLVDRHGREIEGRDLDRLLVDGDTTQGVKPFVEQYPGELRWMTEGDRAFIQNPKEKRRDRAARLFEYLRRVEITLARRIKAVKLPDFALYPVAACPDEVRHAAERKWGTTIPFTRPDPPLCG
jgi:hypothetical protein